MRRKTIHLLTYIVILVISWTGAAYAEDLLRIEIKKDGVYYIYPTDLQNAGVPTDIDSGTIKIFNQGVEIPLYVYGGGDGRLTSSDYIVVGGGRRCREKNDPQRWNTGEPPATLLIC